MKHMNDRLLINQRPAEHGLPPKHINQSDGMIERLPRIDKERDQASENHSKEGELAKQAE